MNDDRPLSPAAAERRARAARRFRTEGVALREAWRESVLRRLPAWRGGWWTPAVESLTRAISETRDPRPACARLGRARAAAGVGINDTVADLSALYQALPEREPPDHLVEVLVRAWTEVTLVPEHAARCVRSLHRLRDVDEVRTLLREIGREARRTGIPVGNRYVLLVADLTVAVPSGSRFAGTACAAMPELPPGAAAGSAAGTAAGPACGTAGGSAAGTVGGPACGTVGGGRTERDLTVSSDPAGVLGQPVFGVELAARFRTAFPGGEPIIPLWPGGYVVLTEASADLLRRTASLRQALAEIGLGAARLWYEDFPDDVPAAQAIYQRLIGN